MTPVVADHSRAQPRVIPAEEPSDPIRPPGLGGRREAREDALAVLYEAEITGDDGSEVLQRRRVSLSDYVVEMVVGVGEAGDRIDEALAGHLRGWDLDRMAVVDRTLARMAAWELLERPDVPTGAVMSELVGLATQYCGAESPRFLNGLLSAVAAEVRG